MIDTSVLVDLEKSKRRNPDAVGAAAERLSGEKGVIAAITVSELLHGVHRASNEGIRARRQAFLRSCLDIFPALPFVRATAEIHSRIWSDLRSRGSMIGAYDLLIGATALEYKIPLLTGNVAEFERVAGLKVLPWNMDT